MSEDTFVNLCNKLLNNDHGVTEEAYTLLCNIANDLGYNIALLKLYKACRRLDEPHRDGTSDRFYYPQNNS